MKDVIRDEINNIKNVNVDGWEDLFNIQPEEDEVRLITGIKPCWYDIGIAPFYLIIHDVSYYRSPNQHSKIIVGTLIFFSENFDIEFPICIEVKKGLYEFANWSFRIAKLVDEEQDIDKPNRGLNVFFEQDIDSVKYLLCATNAKSWKRYWKGQGRYETFLKLIQGIQVNLVKLLVHPSRKAIMKALNYIEYKDVDLDPKDDGMIFSWFAKEILIRCGWNGKGKTL